MRTCSVDIWQSFTSTCIRCQVSAVAISSETWSRRANFKPCFIVRWFLVLAPIAATRQFLIRDDDFHTRDSPDPLPPAAPAELEVANNGRYLLSQKWAHVSSSGGWNCLVNGKRDLLWLRSPSYSYSDRLCGGGSCCGIELRLWTMNPRTPRNKPLTLATWT